MAFPRTLAKLICYFLFISSFYMVATTPQAVYLTRKTTCSTELFAFELFKAVAFSMVFTAYAICFFWEDFPDAEVRIYMRVGLLFLTLTHLLRLFYVLPSNNFSAVVTFSVIAIYGTRALLLPRHLY